MKQNDMAAAIRTVLRIENPDDCKEIDSSCDWRVIKFWALCPCCYELKATGWDLAALVDKATCMDDFTNSLNQL